jgi:hypothetical protein
MNEQPENNVENQEPGPARSSEQGTGPNSTDSGDARTAKRTRTAPLLVERVTALRGQGIAAHKEPKSTLRRQTQADIYNKGAEVPYLKLEAAARDLVCSLMERQDRMNEEIFYKLNDLAFQVGDLEEDRPAAGSATGDTP